VIITALVGSSGLGRDVWYALRSINTGTGLEAGLAIVVLAVILDRLSAALTRQSSSSEPERDPGRLGTIPAQARGRINRRGLSSRLPRWLVSGWFLVAAAGGVAALSLAAGLDRFPQGIQFSLAAPINASVDWMAVNLYFATSWMRDSVMREYGLAPVQTLLGWLPWQAIVVGVVLLSYVRAGVRGVAVAVVGLGFIGVGGVWDLAMGTLSQVLTAVTISVVIGVAVGVWSSQSDTVEAAIRPVLDTMQTMPVFVYLIPVIMLWSSGPMTSIIATIVYAAPPAIRMTNLGIRQVSPAVVETAMSHGATRLQILTQVQVPLAMPTVMMGVNQSIMMALAMVVIGGLVGGGGLGQEVFVSAIYLRLGPGLVAGMAIVFLAMILDRITQAKADTAPR
jgi:glycine betaine/proline transport system permease protein